MGKSQRDKGKAFEQKIARELREYFPDAKRGFQTRGGTNEEPDIKNCGPFAIECKAHRKVNRTAALKQMRDACPDALIPVAVCKDDFQKPVVRLDLQHLKRVLEAAWPFEGEGVEVEMSFEDFKSLCFEVARPKAIQTGERGYYE